MVGLIVFSISKKKKKIIPDADDVPIFRSQTFYLLTKTFSRIDDKKMLVR
jgi:hypothetical protein